MPSEIIQRLWSKLTEHKASSSRDQLVVPCLTVVARVEANCGCDAQTRADSATDWADRSRYQARHCARNRGETGANDVSRHHMVELRVELRVFEFTT
jgi:hypothetical protein